MFRLLKVRMFLLGMTMILPISSWGNVNFSQKPLMAGGGVEPNLMFLLDDSGSMRWGFMPDGLMGGRYLGDCNDAVTYGSNTYCALNVGSRPYLLSSTYNKLYYNPTVTYAPPLRADGENMPSANFFDAPLNGFDPGSSTVNLDNNYRAIMDDYYWYGRAGGYWRYGFTISPYSNATRAFYYEWKDGCGNWQSTNCYDQITISGATERQNFANWFSYYRTREMAAKSGIGSVFADKDISRQFRLGWGVINRGRNNVDGASDVRAVEQGVRPFLDDDEKGINGVKEDFISWLYGVDSSGSTPLQRALEGAGQYYERSQRAWLDDPSKSEGGGNVARQCRMSATMLMTDGYYNTGNGFDPDLNSYADDSDGSVITNGEGAEGQYKAEEPFSDGRTGRITLGDIAAHYWKRDLRTDIDNYVPVIKGKNNDGQRKVIGNPAFWQHMMTYGIGFGVEGSVSRDEAMDSVFSGADLDWWAGSEEEDKINDLLHAAINSRGDFFSAADPETFRTELGRLLTAFFDTTASATGLDFNVATIEEEGALVFSSSFESNGWAGDLVASTYGKGNNGLPQEETGNENKGWSARNVLESAVPDSRTILTWDGATGQPFRWGSLTGAQKADLTFGAPSLGEQRLEYLRGKSKSEIAAFNPDDAKYFRDRTYRLGSIVNSTPRYVGRPDSGWPNDMPGTSMYSEFYNGNLDRVPVVYVGSNDGMLHGFRATENDGGGGEELLAYVPSFVFSAEEEKGLHYLTEPDYEHRFYVDLNLEVVDAFIKGRRKNGNASASRAWRTVLIGGARAGAKGIFALDVSEPSFAEDIAAQHVLWEFSAGDDDRLGYLIEPPEIALMDWGSGPRWTAFVPNGYNSGNRSTGFFMLDIEKGLDGWAPGDYKYHEFAAGGEGLSPLTLIDTNEDYMVDRVYAGDRDGNLWVAKISEGSSTSAYTGPYFKAGQPITAAPAVALSVDSGKDPDLMILFGTGQHLETSDNADTSQQYFYAVHETSDAAPALTVNDLTEINVTGSGSKRETENKRVDYETKRGWYTPLPQSGERVVNYPIIRGEYVYVNTLIPGADPCMGGGYGWVMGFEIVRAENTTPVYRAFKNMDQNVAGIKVSSTPSQLATWGNLLTYGTGTGGAGFTELDPFDDVLGRRGWREITE